jgi:hypothetical protein
MSEGGISSGWLEVAVVGAAAAVTLAKTYGRTIVRNTLDRRRHPARVTRIAASAAGLVGTAGLVAAVNATTPDPSAAPVGWTEQVAHLDPDEADLGAVFVFYDRIPGQAAPDPVDLTYASPWP